MQKKFDDRASFQFKHNSLNTIRLLAAVSVMFGHACTHLSVEKPMIISQVLGYFFGVPIFFALSGYLIWGSIAKSASFGHYIKKRFWRIYPELWVAVFFEILAIVLFYSQPIQWSKLGLFTLTQATFLQFWTPDFLRGYGCGTPNGSLWTICVLIQFYILAYPMRKLLHGKSNKVWLGVIGVSVVIAAVSPLLENLVPTILYKLYNQTIVPYLWLFLIGEYIAEYQNKIVPSFKRNLHWWTLASLSIMYLNVDIMGGPHGYGILRCIALIGSVIGFAYQFPQLNIKTDISYGIYLYHMTIVNILISLGFTGNYGVFVIALVLSVIAAWISTKTVGQKILMVKKSI